MSSICLGTSDEDDNCDCTLFVRRSKKPGCKYCGHDEDSHSKSIATRSREHPAVAATQQDRDKYVNRIVRSLATSAVLEKARKETVQGFRPTPTTSSDVPSTKRKVKPRTASSKVATRSGTKDSFNFGRIVFFPCGDQNLLKFTFPAINSTALGPWVAAGLASEATKPGFSINLAWGTKQVNAFLRPHFPVLFGHFDSTIPGFRDIPDEPDSAGLKKLDYQLPYVLLKKERKNYSVIDKTHPTATSYQEHLTGEKNKTAGFKAKTLFLVTRARIPQETVREWFHPSLAPTIPGESLKRRRSDSISISSDSSDSPQEHKDATAIDEDTEVEDVKAIEHAKKRPRRMPPKAQDTIVPETPEFVEGSSNDTSRDVDALALHLQHSASFNIDNPTWLSDEESDLWNF